MSKQLQIKFPLFSPDLFPRLRQEHGALETAKIEEAKDQIIDHLKHVIAGYKGARTKRNTKNKYRRENENNSTGTQPERDDVA